MAWTLQGSVAEGLFHQTEWPCLPGLTADQRLPGGLQEAPISVPACAYLLSSLLQTSRAKAPARRQCVRETDSRQLCWGRMAWCPCPGEEIDKQLFFLLARRKKISINFLRCWQTGFLFRNSSALPEVALGGMTGHCICPCPGGCGPTWRGFWNP